MSPSPAASPQPAVADGPDLPDLPDVEHVEIHATAGGDGAAVRTFAFHLRDGRALVAPVEWYPRLAGATLDELAVVEMWGDVVEWPLINEVLPVRFLLEGVRGNEGADSLAEWRALMDRRRAQIARGDEPEPHFPTLPLPDGWDADDADDDAADAPGPAPAR